MACQLLKMFCCHSLFRRILFLIEEFERAQSKYHSQIVQELHHLVMGCNPAIHSGYNTEDREFIGGCHRTRTTKFIILSCPYGKYMAEAADTILCAAGCRRYPDGGRFDTNMHNSVHQGEDIMLTDLPQHLARRSA